MKKIIGILTLVLMMFTLSAQKYTYTLKKTLSPAMTSSDYAYWSFPVGTFSGISLSKTDTLDLSIAVDLNKDLPVLPSLEFIFNNKSGSTDSLYISGTIKGSQFHLMTSEPTTGLALTTISSTKINMSTTTPYYYVIADSTNTAGFAIPKSTTAVKNLRSILYTLRFMPKGLTDTVKVTGIRFKTWVNPEF